MPARVKSLNRIFAPGSSYNHAKGHLFRIIAVPSGISINKDKNLQDPEAKAGVLAAAARLF